MNFLWRDCSLKGNGRLLYYIAGVFVFGTWLAHASAQTPPFNGNQHFTQDAAYYLPASNTSNFLTVNAGQTADAVAGVNLEFYVERLAGPSPTNRLFVLYATQDGQIDFRNSAVTIGSYGSDSTDRIRYAVNAIGGSVYLGDNSVIHANAPLYEGTALHADSMNGTAAYIRVGDNAELYGAVCGTYFATVMANANSTIDIGQNAIIFNTSTEVIEDETLSPQVAVMAMGNGAVTIGGGSQIETFSPSRGAYGIRAGNLYSDGTVSLGNDSTVVTQGEDSYALLADGTTSSITTGNIIVYTSGKGGYGVYATRNSTITLGAESTIHTAGEQGFATVRNPNSTLRIGDGTYILTEGTDGIGIFASGGVIEAGDDIIIQTIGNGSHAVRASGVTANTTVGDGLIVETRTGHGAYASVGGTTIIGKNADITVNNYAAIYARGSNSRVEIGEGSSVRTVEDSAYIVTADNNGSVLLKDGVSLSAAGDEVLGIYAATGGQVTFGDLTLSVIPSGRTNAIFAYNDGASVTGSGVLDISGTVFAMDTNGTGASVDLQFDNGSRFDGIAWSMGTNARVNMTFIGADSHWNMEADSLMTNLTLRDGFHHTIPHDTLIDTENTRISGGATLDLIGSLEVSNTLAGEAGLAPGRMNFYGGGGMAGINNFGEIGSTLDTHFYIDSSPRGVTSADVSGTASMDNLTIEATVWGFAHLSSDEYTLINNSGGGTRTGTTNVVNNTLTAYEVLEDADRVYLEFNEDLLEHIWDDPTNCYSFAGGSYQGMIKIIAEEETGLVLKFTNMTDDLAPVLADYLNAGLGNSNLHFSLYGEDSLVLSGDGYLQDGYAYFGWDLTDFNRIYSSDVKLSSFEVPEPATWVLLLSMFGILWCRRRKGLAKK